MNRKSDEARTLLRRLLNQADQLAKSNGENGATIPVRAAKPVESSPVRPPAPASVPAPTPLAPRMTQTAPAAQTSHIIEDRLQAEEALARIREKTTQAANEFAEGKINRAQFTAIYAHFSEQRTIIERLLTRNPDSQAWQQVARGGQTTFLRQHFEARVLAYAIYDNGDANGDTPLTNSGTALTPEISTPILKAMQVLLKTRAKDKPLKALRKAVEHGRWLAIIPGVYTSALALFSLEPSTEQFDKVVDMHRDFERANRVALARGIRVPDQLVFPHRALFEKPGQSVE